MLGLCVYINCPPIRAVCTNHEVVVSKPRTVNSMYLDSIAIINNFIIVPPDPPVSTVSGSFYITSSSYRPPNQKLFVFVTPIYITHSPLPILAWSTVQLDFLHTLQPPPVSLHHSSLHPTTYACVCRRFLSTLSPPLTPSA